MQRKTILEILVVVIALAIIGTIVFVGVQKNKSQAPEIKNLDTVGLANVPGANKVANDGSVVTDEGTPVELDVSLLSPDAPHQSNPITESDVPEGVVEITVSANGFSPTEFTVLTNKALAISVTSTDTQTHIFKFDSPQLSAVAVGISPGETRLISFNAPAKGEYSFFCDVPGHKDRGEVGKMIVK